MNTNTTGAKFEVSSEHTHSTPAEAIDVLIARMLETLAQLGAA
jgi:hypothetical protein